VSTTILPGTIAIRTRALVLISLEFIDVNVETNPMSPFGDVKSGYIKLDTLMTSGWVMRQITRHEQSWRHDRELILSTPGRTDVWTAKATMDDDDYQGSKLIVACLGRGNLYWTALLLEPILDKSQTYRRVGFVEMRIDTKRQEDRWVIFWEDIEP
jgi:hypothetical protein